MIVLSDKEIVLTREQYMKVGSDSNIMNDMYEMKLGHNLRVIDNDYVLSFLDRQTYDMFMGYIYEPYLREVTL
jgi:hypothetical protein|tara:strand:- start:298 stop:516 length:219 start_codon:yes stop_codon:yes gene_type:complete